MKATQDIDLEQIVQDIKTYKIELLAYQDSDEPTGELEALEKSIDAKIESELVWEADVLNWIGYFGIVQVNEQLLEQAPCTIHQALSTLMVELFNEKAKEE